MKQGRGRDGVYQLSATETDEHLRAVQEEADHEDGSPLHGGPCGRGEIEGSKAGCDAHCVRHHHLVTTSIWS